MLSVLRSVMSSSLSRRCSVEFSRSIGRVVKKARQTSKHWEIFARYGVRIRAKKVWGRIATKVLKRRVEWGANEHFKTLQLEGTDICVEVFFKASQEYSYPCSKARSISGECTSSDPQVEEANL